MSCESTADPPTDKKTIDEDGEATVKPVDETPKLLLSTATSFCAICMSMGAEDPDAAPQETPEGEEGGAGEAEGEEGGEPAEQQDISSAFVRCLDPPHQKSQRTDLGLSSSIKLKC
eukprot:symbB.v1.2.036348.t1/scaffold5111.1/size30776/4